MKRKWLFATALLTPLLANAGFFDDAINQVKKSAKEAYDKSAEKVTETADPPPEQSDPAESNTPAPTTQTPSAQNPEAQSPLGGDDYIALDAIPSGRRPATPESLGLVRLRYQPDWMDEKTLLNLTEGVIYCQQNIINTQGHIRGCIGKRNNLSVQGGSDISVVRVFEPEEISGKNRKFVAQANKDRVKPVLIRLANHLSPQFANTVTWRGKYDFDNQSLTISIRNLEQAGSYHTNRIPEELAHLDVYKTPDRNFGGIRGERYPMQAYIPEGLSGGIIALAFDRKLSEGRLPIPASKAEALFRNVSGNDISGMAVVEFTVDRTLGKAAVATLERVLILPYDQGAVDPKTVQPVLTVPASAFPKLSPAKKAASKPTAKPQSKPAEAPKPAAAPAPSIDPYARAGAGKAFGPDVIGLRMGMTLQQADEIIRRDRKLMKVIDGDPPRPFAAARMYVLEPGNEYIALMAMKTSGAERLASIDRTLYFDPDDPPSQTAITASVDKKYGDPRYVYETKGRFERLWHTAEADSPDAPDLDVQRACKYALTGSAPDVWLDNGEYYQWTMPWRETKYMGVRAGTAVGDHRDLVANNVNQCGPTIISRYSDNSGMLTGPELRVHVYDPAWIYADYSKLEAADAEGGAKDLDL